MARKNLGRKGEKVKRGKRRPENPVSPLSRSGVTSSRKLTVSIVGSGRLGTALALALSQNGYIVEAVVARRLRNARRSARLIGRNTQALSSSHLDLLPASRIIFITTPDDEIETCAERLAAIFSKNSKAERAVAMHASGALPSSLLSPLRAMGFSIASMHPLVAVSHPQSGAERLRDAYFCLEGEREALLVARKIVRDLGAKSFSISSRDKALYHAAAVMASGNMVALFDISTEMLRACGLKEREARAVLMPLVRSTLENLAEQTPQRALTGTFARADASTVHEHLAALRLLSSREALAAYVLLGLRSLRLAEERGADAGAVNAIKKLLNDAL